jgi:hypothetical protein
MGKGYGICTEVAMGTVMGSCFAQYALSRPCERYRDPVYARHMPPVQLFLLFGLDEETAPLLPV